MHDEARMLAREFARTLARLREHWGREYVSRAPIPWPPRVESVEPPTREVVPDRGPDLPRIASEPTQGPVPSPAIHQRAVEWSAAEKLEYLRRKNIGDCRRCPLCRTRKNIVFGVGDPEAKLMFVGEAPGADEDRRGEPFVGRAGQRLDQWIVALGLRREDVYIANVLKCRPPDNRDPKPEEVDKCAPFLKAQIRAIAPRVIVALGRHAGMLLSRREDMTLKAMRSTRLHYDASGPNDAAGARLVPLVVTYHPAYVLRQDRAGQGRSAEDETVMNDLRRALALVDGEGSR